jgi:CRISPR-associated protein Cas1
MPAGIWLPLSGHIQTGGRTRAQLEAGKPLNKQLWQSTVKAKIVNQASVLRNFGRPTATMDRLAQSVRSGDSTNAEATAAAYYWKFWSLDRPDFRRDPDGEPPNHLLNFGYAVLRSMTARYLIGSGLWPVYGMFHGNMYNAFPLADDVMEPYRPFVDHLVADHVESNPDAALDVFMSRETRTHLLSIAFMDVDMDGSIRPLQNALQQTCASLAKAYEEKEARLLTYPRILTPNGL